MTAGFSFRNARLRERQESLCREVILEALLLLSRQIAREGSGKFTIENDLNRQLYKCIFEANKGRELRGARSLAFMPIYDSPNPPIGQYPSAQERKRPDFRWEFQDPQEVNLETAIVSFVIECKRLGENIRGKDLVELYVSTGVRRFIHEEWSYGRNCASGMMVGYVQSADPVNLLDRVNTHVADSGCEKISLLIMENGILQGQHALVRNIRISPFDLRHAWVDLRKE
jgi:hypothetical protein